MTTPSLPASGRQDFYGSALRPEQTLQLVNAIVAGGQFAGTLNRQPTDMASIVFPVLTGTDEPEWTSELAPIPVLGLDGEPVVVAPSRLSGIVLISREAANDGGLNVTAQVEQALRDRFSAVLDRDLLSGTGAAPVPAGLIGQATPVTGNDLWSAVVRAKAQISAAGGTPSHLACDPDVLGAEEARTDADGRPLWPDGLTTFAGVTVVPTAGATDPLLYDAARTMLVVRTDFEALTSEDYTPAFERYALALRLTVRMAAAAPAPGMSMRKLIISGAGDGATGDGATRAARTTAKAGKTA